MADTKEIELVKDAKGHWIAPFTIPIGRPTKYHEGVCEEVVKLGAIGYSLCQMAAHFHVTRKTLQNWSQEHPDFFAALSLAMEYSQAWWEQWGRIGLTTPGFNAAHWKTNVYNRFRDDYMDRPDATITIGSNQDNQKRIDVRVLDDDERDTLKQLLLTAIGRDLDEDE